MRVLNILLLLLPLTGCQICLADNSNEPFNLTRYRQMPPLFQLEDYDVCMEEGTYCVVYGEIVPNASSPLWHQIDEFSKDHKFHYRHDHVFFGVCLESCQRSIQSLSFRQQQDLDDGGELDTELIQYFNRIHKRSVNDNRRFRQTINNCLNHEFFKKYQLRLRTYIEYCVRADDELPHDYWDITLYVVFALFLALCFFSTIYDRYQRRMQPSATKLIGNNFFKQDLKAPVQRLLASFSVTRNYYRILLPTKGTFARDSRFFHGFRVLTIVQVIAAHLIMLFMAIQVENPEFFEQFLTTIEAALFQNGHVIIQIYFMISSFLLYVKFKDREMIKKESKVTTCIAVYFRVFILRYLRLLPSLLLLIVVNTTILTRLSDGPLWRHVTEPERVLCRENWWANVLFINNFFMTDICSLQTWYLSADTQLFQFYLLVIIVIMKYPQLKKSIYSLIAILAVIIPACITYFHKLEAVYHLNPEMYRYLFYRNAETYTKTYPMFYTNLGGYLMGFICGEVYLKLRKAGNVNQIRRKWKLPWSFWLFPVIAYTAIYSGYIFIRYDFKTPSIFMSVYAGLYKNLWVLSFAACMCCFWLKAGKLFYRLCCLPVFRPLSRVSFQAYLWHFVAVRLIGANFRNPVYVTRFYLFCYIALAVVISHFIALAVALVFEYPLAEILKYFMSQDNKQTTEQTPTEDDHEETKVGTKSTIFPKFQYTNN